MNEPRWYILKKDKVVPVDIEGYVKWKASKTKEDGSTIILQDVLGEMLISTTFLGLDHNLGMAGPPKLFETMAFPIDIGSKKIVDFDDDLFCDRYSTLSQAVAGHKKIIKQAIANRLMYLVKYKCKVGIKPTPLYRNPDFIDYFKRRGIK